MVYRCPKKLSALSSKQKTLMTSNTPLLKILKLNKVQPDIRYL